MADTTYTVRVDGKTHKIKGTSMNPNDGALEIYDDGGLVALFAKGMWSSVEAETDEKRQKREEETANMATDQNDAERGLDNQQHYAEKSAKGENPTLGNPDARAINGDVKTGEGEEDAKASRKAGK